MRPGSLGAKIKASWAVSFWRLCGRVCFLPEVACFPWLRVSSSILTAGYAASLHLSMVTSPSGSPFLPTSCPFEELVIAQGHPGEQG